MFFYVSMALKLSQYSIESAITLVKTSHEYIQAKKRLVVY